MSRMTSICQLIFHQIFGDVDCSLVSVRTQGGCVFSMSYSVGALTNPLESQKHQQGLEVMDLR